MTALLAHVDESIRSGGSLLGAVIVRVGVEGWIWWPYDEGHGER